MVDNILIQSDGLLLQKVVDSIDDEQFTVLITDDGSPYGTVMTGQLSLQTITSFSYQYNEKLLDELQDKLHQLIENDRTVNFHVVNHTLEYINEKHILKLHVYYKEYPFYIEFNL